MVAPDPAVRRAHYENNKEAYVARAREQKAKLRRVIRETKHNQPCADCGVVYPYYVMDFDHLGNKVDNVRVFATKGSLRSLLEEIAKCEIVCANCHRIRTFHRSIA